VNDDDPESLRALEELAGSTCRGRRAEPWSPGSAEDPWARLHVARAEIERLAAARRPIPARPALQVIEGGRFAGCSPCECGGHPACPRCNP
jgi:hypothetical protein